MCGSSFLYSLLGILCCLLHQEDQFPCPLVMNEWTGFTFPIHSFPEYETFGGGGPSFMEKGSLVRFSIWGESYSLVSVLSEEIIKIKA